jgi:hypothetical protein
LDYLKISLTEEQRKNVHKAIKHINESFDKRNIKMDTADLALLPNDFNKKSPDNFILSVALIYKSENPIMLTSDNGLQIKAKGLGITTITLKAFLNQGNIDQPPDPPHRKDGLVLCQHTRQTLQSTLWYCSQFLTVIFFVAMLPKHLAHCLFRFAPQPKSQANTQHSNKKTLHSNHHHRSAYASIKTA